jgi:phospholipase/carboxylesterase
MVNLSARLNLHNIRWIAPAAGQDSSRYPGVLMDPVESNEPALTEAIKVIDSARERATESGRIHEAETVMIGFSQGACLTVEYALRHPGKCGTLVVLTGGLFGPPGTQWSGTPDMLAGTRVLITGSDVDEWIPEARVHETARVLEGFGARVEVRTYAGRPHEVSDAELEEAGESIKKAQPRP